MKHTSLTLLAFLLLFIHFLVPVNRSLASLDERQILSEAWYLFNAGDMESARGKFMMIEQSDNGEIRSDARMGLGYIYLRQNRQKDAEAIFSGLVDNRHNLLKTLPALLQSLPEDSPRRYGISQDILSLNPSDAQALTVVAWHHYHQKEYQTSKVYFERLLEQRPDDNGAAVGLGYSLMHLDEVTQALEVVDQPAVEKTRPVIELKQSILSRLIRTAMEKGNTRHAISLFRQMVETDMNSTAASDASRHILATLMASGQDENAWEFAGELSASSHPALKESASWFYFTHGAPITAAQTFNDPETCHYNAGSPQVEAFAFRRHRSGDDGTSQLDETLFPISVILPVTTGQKWRVTWVSKQLNSGSPKAYQAGSYYLNINGDRPLSYLDNTADTQQVFLGWDKEGRIPVRAKIGTSPIDGAVDVTPVFQLDTQLSGVRINLHRESIEESILSYTGLEDPYGRAAWGRVTKNGGTVGKTFALDDGWWISSDGGFDIYRGENVINNHGWHLDLAMGRTLLWQNTWEITWGGYASYQHFDKNSNFFTYGHGGYYSPDYMISAGPLFRIKTIECRDFWLDAQFSAGWMIEQNSSIDRYPLKDVSTSGLSAAASEELLGTFAGSSKDGPTLSIQVEAGKAITKNISCGGFFSMNLSPEYDEWNVGIGVRISLEAMNGFFTHQLFQDNLEFR